MKGNNAEHILQSKQIVPGEDSIGLHIRNLLNLLIGCAGWRDSPLNPTGNFVGQLLCAVSYGITYGTDK